MAARKSLGHLPSTHLVLAVASLALVFGHPTALPEDLITSHPGPFPEAEGGDPATRHPWEDRHVPPPTPYLPPLPPGDPGTEYRARSQNPFETSVCSLSACACKNRTKDGKELVDISCNCRGTNFVLKIREGMLPKLADSLEIADCNLVQLDGMAPGGETEDEGELQVSGGRGSNRKKNRKTKFQYARRRREVKVGDGEEADDGGVEWEEAVWEAELGPPDDEDSEDPPEEEEEEEEEEDSTPEGEESEKGGRYARAAAPGKKQPHPLSYLSVRRVRELRMEPHAVGAVRSVLLEDVRLIRVFPPYAFQPPPPAPAIHPSGFSQAEAPPHGTQWEMDSVTFRNVTEIGSFSISSFANVLINSHFLWLHTNVVIMETNAVRVVFPSVDEDDSVDPCETSYRAEDGQTEGELNSIANQSPEVEEGLSTPVGNGSEGLKSTCEATQGGFTVANSVISMWGMSAFSIVGARSVVFDGCHASRLSPSSIFVGGANFFSFTRNSVLETVSMFAFSVTASFVEFRRNRFERLEEGAMSGVKPMASKISFGMPHLAFEDNLLMDVDLLSLHPNWDISMFHNNGVDHNMEGYSFQKNAFADCSCPHLGWIVQLAKEQEPSSNFYTHLLNDESGNYCVKEPVEPLGFILPCRLPLKGINSLFEDDGVTCKRHVDVIELCNMYCSAASSLMHTYHFQDLFALTSLAILCVLMSSSFWIIT